MEATTNREKVDVLSEIILTKMPLHYDRIVGIKKGNILLAAHTAYRANKPLALIKTDYSFKMGYPFDGEICKREQVVLVDDIASDASMLLHAIHQLGMYNVQVINVVALIERKEGDAREKLAKANCQLRSVCVAGDDDIRRLIEKNLPFPVGP
jgi:orotate phosphoribosyltransferase